MSDPATNIGLGIVAVGAIALVFILDRRVKTKGNLFTGKATPTSRIAAFLLGLTFAAFLAVTIYSSKGHLFSPELLIFVIACIALFSYSIGDGSFLQQIQKDRFRVFDSQTEHGSDRTVRQTTLRRVIVIIGALLIIGLIAFACVWSVVGLDRLVEVLVLTGFLICISFAAFAWLLHFYEIVRLLTRTK